jgi:FecR protein
MGRRLRMIRAEPDDSSEETAIHCASVLITACLFACAAAFELASISPGAAQGDSPQQALPAQTIVQFVADPGALLKQYPNGGPKMIARVRDLAASDPATLKPMVGLIPGANSDQANAIGTGLGQVAVMVTKANPTYANEIQEAVAKSDGGVNLGEGSAEPKIGNAVTIKNQVEGVTEKGPQPILVGTDVYRNELVRTGPSAMAQLLFADRTNLSIAPVTEIRLDSFVYDPNAKSGNVVVNATEGAFRFITGLQASRNYAIKTPFATLGVRGTEFIVVIGPNEEQIQLNKGEVIVTTISNKRAALDTPSTVLSVDSQGNIHGPTPMSQPLMNFADLGAPVTNLAFADAQNAFAAVTGSTSIGATGGAAGGGGGGGGESQTGQTAGLASFAVNSTFALRTSATAPTTLLSLTTGTFGGGAASISQTTGTVSQTISATNP